MIIRQGNQPMVQTIGTVPPPVFGNPPNQAFYGYQPPTQQNPMPYGFSQPQVVNNNTSQPMMISNGPRPYIENPAINTVNTINSTQYSTNPY